MLLRFLQRFPLGSLSLWAMWWQNVLREFPLWFLEYVNDIKCTRSNSSLRQWSHYEQGTKSLVDIHTGYFNWCKAAQLEIFLMSFQLTRTVLVVQLGRCVSLMTPWSASLWNPFRHQASQAKSLTLPDTSPGLFVILNIYIKIKAGQIFFNVAYTNRFFL